MTWQSCEQKQKQIFVSEFNLFYQITSILVLAGLVAMLVSYLKQPSIIAFILTGLVVGSLGYGHFHQSGTLDTLGQIGITLLLFMVGLELDLKRIKALGKVAALTGLGQIVFTSLIGFAITKLFGFSNIVSFYLSLALTFSSTIIVVKLLGEKRDLQALYARIVVGFLIVQDFVALILLLVLGGSAHSGGSDIFKSLPTWQYALAMSVKVLILVLCLSWMSKKLFPKFLDRFGKSDELLMIFSLAWALGLAAFMSLPAVGFSLEVGGFVAGLALANSNVHFEISARVKSLRDFFLIIFFIVFGAKLVFTGLGPILMPALVLSLYVSVGNPLIMMFIMGALGYTPRTSFFAAVTTAQVSEFSFVLVALGNRLGHVPDAILGLVSLVGLITIALSSYSILYTRRLYEFLRPALKWFNFKKGRAEEGLEDGVFKNHIILAGANRLGSRLLLGLSGRRQKVTVVDFDPHIAHLHRALNFDVICGDITDPFIQDQVNLELAKLVISTIPDLDDNLALVSAIRQRTAALKKRPKLIFTAQNDFESKLLYEQGVDYVLSPHFIGGLHLSKILEEDNLLSSLKNLRKEHLDVLG
ncbi:MAG: cation:proton antiporter [Candidatus Doudnabacteria bacterium]|nr:cation:proton antiporter [Candidatus Doudnabacteria bacterium]